LKERLVGAAVLMAAAVILIPEMLSGPRRAPAPSASPAEKAEGSLKRYTIDLEPATMPPPAESLATPTVIEEPAPPPEDVTPDPTPNTTAAAPQGEHVEPSQAEPAELAAATTEPRPQPVESTPQPELAAPSPSPAAATQAPQIAPPSAAAPATGRRWAVQLIAYDKREQAQRMAEDLRSSNIAAFVMPVAAKTGTLYRVRVGPFMTRAEAEAAVPKLRAVSTDPTVVAQP